jgi:ribosome-binding protein aMBF1 (putative translation factor)
MGVEGPKQRGTAEVHLFAVNPMDLKKATAPNVRRARHAKEMIQKELAGRAGLSVRYLGSIKHATVSASVTVLGRLAQALDVDACELIRMPSRR